MNKVTTPATTCLVVLWLACLQSTAQGQEFKTVIGPSNEDLHAGAELLKEGEAEEGLKRTLEGLEYAISNREKVAGMSNACAAHVMMSQYEEALPWCDQALEINRRKTTSAGCNGCCRASATSGPS